MQENTRVRQSGEIVYSGDSLNYIGFPVGGIGTGDVLIGGRGNIRSLEIFNHAAMSGNLPYMTFFSLWCRKGNEEPKAMIMEGKLPADAPGPYGLQRNQLAGLPRFERSVFSGMFPFAKIRLADDSIPLNISGEFFNPLIPLDVDNSSLPVAAFYWTLGNPTDDTVFASVNFNLGNPLRQSGRNGRPTHLGNRNEYYKSGDLRGVAMGNREKPGSELFGNLLMASSYPNLNIQTAWHEGAWWDDATLYWEDFAEDGVISDRHEQVT
jgi:uncharacterized protein (DUF608 family)